MQLIIVKNNNNNKTDLGLISCFGGRLHTRQCLVEESKWGDEAGGHTVPPNGFQLQVGSHMTCEVGEMRPYDEFEFSKWQKIWLKCPSGQHCSNKSLWKTSPTLREWWSTGAILL